MLSLRTLTMTSALALALAAQPAVAQVVPRTTPRIDPTAAPRRVLTPQDQLAPNRLQLRVAGPMTLSVIDPGYVEDSDGDTRTLDITACVNDGNGNAGDVSAITYRLDLPGGARSGTMDLPVLDGGPRRPDVLKGTPTKSAGTVAGCRRARLELPACSLPAGEVPLIVRADALTAETRTMIAPVRSKITLDPISAADLGTPVTIGGSASSRCGTPVKTVTLSATGSPSVTVPVPANGKFSAPFVFRRAGNARLVAGTEGEDDYSSAVAFDDVTVAKVPMTLALGSVADSVRIGGTLPVTARLLNAQTQQPLPGVPVALRLASAPDCMATTGEDGTVRCTLAVPVDNDLVGGKYAVAAQVADASALNLTGTETLVVTNADGLIVKTIPDYWVAVILEEARPGGVLLHNFNPGWSGTGAHLGNASRLYNGPSLDKYESFDIPSKLLKLDKHDVFYLNNIFIRFKPFVLKAPARVRAELYVTGFEGRGPSIKGFCFWGWCIADYDGMMPDITNISLPRGRVELDLAIVDGKVKASLAAIDVQVDFKCGGAAAPLCALALPTLNDVLAGRLKQPSLVDPMLARIGANLDAQIETRRKDWMIDRVTGLSWDDAGNLTVAGTPAAS